jgi:hypothetical protein
MPSNTGQTNDPSGDHTLHPMLASQKSSKVPQEIWENIIKVGDLSGATLKALRLTTSFLKDFATPELFKVACVSVNKANIIAFEHILASPHLSRHIQTLVLDAATYESRITTKKYADRAAKYFKEVLGLKEPGYLSASNLREVLEDETSNTAFGQLFRAGFVSYYTRAEFQDTMFSEAQQVRQEPGRWHPTLDWINPTRQIMRPLFHDIFYSCPKLCRVELSTRWESTTNEPLRQFLAATLTPAELGTITAGVPLSPITQQAGVAQSLFSGPGPLARSLHPLSLPPCVVVTVRGRRLSSMMLQSLIRQMTVSKGRIQCLTLGHEDHYPEVLNLNPEVPHLRDTWTRSISPLELTLFPAKWSKPGVDALVLAFSSLRVLKVRLSHGAYNSRTIRHAFQSITGLEQLAFIIEDNGDIARYSSLHELLLKDRQGNGDCHFHDAHLVDIYDHRSTSIFQPVQSQDMLSFGDAHPANMLRLLNPVPWQNMVSLRLGKMKATRHDLATLLIMVSPTLRHLSLYHVCLGSCTCVVPLQQWQPAWRGFKSDTSDRYDFWSKAVIMINNVLTLQTCEITLHGEDSQALERALLMTFSSSNHDYVNEAMANDNLLGDYVIGAHRQTLKQWIYSEYVVPKMADGPSRGRKRKLVDVGDGAGGGSGSGTNV